MRCRFCESKYHFHMDGVEWKELAKEKLQAMTKASIVKESEDIVEEMDAIEEVCTLEKTDSRQEIVIKDGITQITEEARNCASLHTVCTSSVVGRSWLKAYRTCRNLLKKARR